MLLISDIYMLLISKTWRMSFKGYTRRVSQTWRMLLIRLEKCTSFAAKHDLLVYIRGTRIHDSRRIDAAMNAAINSTTIMRMMCCSVLQRDTAMMQTMRRRIIRIIPRVVYSRHSHDAHTRHSHDAHTCSCMSRLPTACVSDSRCSVAVLRRGEDTLLIFPFY